MGCYICVEQSEAVIIENWGKFSQVGQPGCHCLTPCMSNVAGKVSLRLEEMRVRIDSKSKDNVFLTVSVGVQYQILPQSIEKAFYTLESPQVAINAYIQNAVRGHIPTHDLDDIYSSREEISFAVKKEIDQHMAGYGYEVVSVLLTDIEPAHKVTEAMNQIQTYSRLKTAAVDKAEAHKIQVIKSAEADAESKRLSGVGLAEQRRAIVGGLQASIETFQEGVRDLSHEDIMSLLLLNQYFDTLNHVAKSSSGTTLFLNHNGGLKEVAAQMQEGILVKKRN